MALDKCSGIVSCVMSRYTLMITVFFPSMVTRPAARSLWLNSLISEICSLLLAVIEARGFPDLFEGMVLVFCGSKASVDL